MTPYLVFSCDDDTSCVPHVSRLELEHRLEEVLRRHGEEADLGVGVEAVQVG